MKRILLAIFLAVLFLMPGIGFTAEITQSKTFQWDYESTEITNIDGWRIYQSDTALGEYAELVSFPRTEILSSSQDIVITGPAGATITKYYKMTAYNSLGESALSNTASTEFLIPQSAEFGVIVNFRVQTN